MSKKQLLKILLILLLGCNNQLIEDPIQTEVPPPSKLMLRLQLADTLHISVDSTTRTVNSVNFYHSRRNQYFDYDPISHRIQVYNLNSANLEYTISLKKEGPETIEELLGIYVVNGDSIFLVTESPRKRIILMDSVGIQHANWFIKDPLPDGLFEYDLYFSDNFELDYNPLKKSITLSIAPYLEPWKVEYYDQGFIIDFNLANNKILNQYGYFPNPDDVYLFLEENGRFKFQDKEIVYFYGSSLFIVHDLDTKKRLKYIDVPSKNIKGDIPPIGRKIVEEQDMQAQSKYYVEQGRYLVARFDPHRKLIYRLVKKPMDYLDIDNTPKTVNDFEYVLMLLDSNFSIVDEFHLGPGIYNTRICFVNERGLWLSLNNPKNKSINEDMLTLVCLRPEKYENN